MRKRTLSIIREAVSLKYFSFTNKINNSFFVSFVDKYKQNFIINTNLHTYLSTYSHNNSKDCITINVKSILCKHNVLHNQRVSILFPIKWGSLLPICNKHMLGFPIKQKQKYSSLISKYLTWKLITEKYNSTSTVVATTLIGTNSNLHNSYSTSNDGKNNNIDGRPPLQSSSVKDDTNYGGDKTQMAVLNTVCRKIYYLGINRIKNEKEWEKYIIDFCKEIKYYEFINLKSIFMLLLGITKSKEHVKNISSFTIIKNDITHQHYKKKIHIYDIVYIYIDILAKKIKSMTKNQLSIFLYLLQKWNKTQKYEDIIYTIICEQISANTKMRNFNVRSFCSILHLYAKNYQIYANFDNSQNNRNYQNTEKRFCIGTSREDTANKLSSSMKNCIVTDEHIKKIVSKFLRTKFRLEDVLYFLSSMYKLKINKNSIFESSLVQMLNENLINANYFLTPSLVLQLANLNIYNEELYKKLKCIIMQNYYFYNSVHITNIFYAFSKFNADSAVYDLFEKLSTHIMYNFPQKEKPSSSMKEEQNLCSPTNENTQNRCMNNIFSTFNIFQVTTIINSCLKCNYMKYDFFHALLLKVFTPTEAVTAVEGVTSETEQIQGQHTLDNLVNHLDVISKILKSFKIFVYKHITCFHHYDKGNEDKNPQVGQCTRPNNCPLEDVYFDEGYPVCLLNKEWVHKKVYRYASNYCLKGNDDNDRHYDCFFLPYVDQNEVSSKKIREQNKFELFWDNVSEKIRIIIENNLYDEKLKYILHNLMLCLSFSEVRFTNLHAYCQVIVKENFHFFTLNSLYMYIKIWYKFKIFNYEILEILLEQIYKNFHLLQDKKKIKINLLSYIIFKKINTQKGNQLIHLFLYEGENNKLKFEKENLKEKKNFNPTSTWDLPTETQLKQNFKNVEICSNFPIINYDEVDNRSYNGATRDDNSLSEEKRISECATIVQGKKEKASSSTRINESVCKQVERTESTPCSLHFFDYLNFSLFLILTQKSNADGCFELSALFSKGGSSSSSSSNSSSNSSIVLMHFSEGGKEEVLEKYSKRVEKNILNRKESIVRFFLIFADYLGNEKSSLHIFQMLYILHFIKIINEDIYSDIMKLEKMKNFSSPSAANKSEAYHNKKIFRLRKEDLQFINLAGGGNTTERDEVAGDEFQCEHTPCYSFSLHENNTHYAHYAYYRYQYESVKESIRSLSKVFKTFKYNQAICASRESKYSLKRIEVFYKLSTFLTVDMMFELEKENQEFYHFLLFYPQELKRTIVSVREDGTSFFKYEYDDSPLIHTEILFIYNFLKKIFPKNIRFSIVDTTQFITLSTYENEKVKTERVCEHVFNNDIKSNAIEFILEHIMGM
ncbi:conserved Plasmodium protein, unknown function [Plasmodium malariae]|uniref:Uncharacterized protein n=1 Tax=Plasmodium malariae TaxID=5858 RepID=A0A1D3JJG7_PLAMA|nr:conserved Plasmodium protein, unknown function [Plasmodium malariae]SBT86523.1 conserved Plasmodium protein, unknown function [Plasmodium malariae]